MNYLKRPTKSIMSAYGPAFETLPELTKVLEHDPCFRLKVKRNRITAGIKEGVFLDMTISGRVDDDNLHTSLINVIRQHYNFRFSQHTASMSLFLTELATSGWDVVESSIRQDDTHLSMISINNRTHHKCELHLSLNVLDHFIGEADYSFFADLYPEV